VTNEHRLTYTEVVPRRRLAYTRLADFIPGVKMVLTFDGMHDEHWTQMAVMGWESELDKLAKLLKAV
jgi:hypothetical protein